MIDAITTAIGTVVGTLLLLWIIPWFPKPRRNREQLPPPPDVDYELPSLDDGELP